MGHYASEMEGDGILSVQQEASLKRFKLSHERDQALREARAIGMVATIEHLVQHSPIPVEIAYVIRHLGLDGRGPEADAVTEAIGRLMARQESRLRLTGDQKFVMDKP